MFSLKPPVLALSLLAALCAPLTANAQEASLRKALTERLPNLPKIDEVSKTPMSGLFEVRMGNDVIYTDATGRFIIQGSLIDTVERVNLTQERIDKLSALPLEKMPLKDSFAIVRGNGKRKLVVFEDPNCSFCKRFEKDLATLDNITIHVLLYPVLGPDSLTKSKHIWCAKDKAKAYEDWMLKNITPQAASCDTSALDRNLAFGQANRITGTPTSFTASGVRLAGALPVAQIEQALAAEPK